MRDRQMPLLTSCLIAFLFCFTASTTSGLLAGEIAKGTLFGNPAVQSDLRLTDDQRKTINEILTEMEEAIATELKAANLDGDMADPRQKESIISSMIEKYGNRASGVLDRDQKIRFWQIGAQSSGVGVFSNNRTLRLLKITKDQIQKMQSLHSQMAARVTKAAVDPAITISELLELKDQENQKLFDAYRELLTPEQSKGLDELLGKRFDLELLKNPDAKKPRSLSFVFDLSWRNAHSLLSDPKLQEKCRFTPEQVEKITSIFKQTDAQVTAVRLKVLKALPVDFSELKEEEKSQAASKILDGAREIFLATDTQIAKLLSAEQLDQLDRQLIRIIHVRAIGSERIAAKLELTADQKRAFVEAETEFDQTTAPLRVVQSKRFFNQQLAEKREKQFESKVTSVLSATQLEKLESLANE